MTLETCLILLSVYQFLFFVQSTIAIDTTIFPKGNRKMNFRNTLSITIFLVGLVGYIILIIKYHGHYI
jgi:phosphate starvation-inducible membrane PsiE